MKEIIFIILKGLCFLVALLRTGIVIIDVIGILIKKQEEISFWSFGISWSCFYVLHLIENIW